MLLRPVGLALLFLLPKYVSSKLFLASDLVLFLFKPRKCSGVARSQVWPGLAWPCEQLSGDSGTFPGHPWGCVLPVPELGGGSTSVVR